MNIDGPKYDILTGVGSSLGTFILNSIIFLTLGFTCGYYYVRQRTKLNSQEQTSPTYEDINVSYKPHEFLQVTPNVAYDCVGPSSK